MPAMQTLDADDARGESTGLPARTCTHGQLATQLLRDTPTSSGYADSRFGVLAGSRIRLSPCEACDQLPGSRAVHPAWSMVFVISAARSGVTGWPPMSLSWISRHSFARLTWRWNCSSAQFCEPAQAVRIDNPLAAASPRKDPVQPRWDKVPPHSADETRYHHQAASGD